MNSVLLLIIFYLQQKQQMRVENNEERLVSQVALQYTKLMILNLTHSISKFRLVLNSVEDVIWIIELSPIRYSTLNLLPKMNELV